MSIGPRQYRATWERLRNNAYRRRYNRPGDEGDFLSQEERDLEVIMEFVKQLEHVIKGG